MIRFLSAMDQQNTELGSLGAAGKNPSPGFLKLLGLLPQSLRIIVRPAYRRDNA